MKTTDIIKMIAISLVSAASVAIMAGWAVWYYPDDIAGHKGEITKSELESLQAFDLRDPQGDAERAMKRGDFRLWPFRRTYFEHWGPQEVHYIPVGISCEDPIKPYRVAARSHKYFPDQILFSPKSSDLAALAIERILVDISPPDRRIVGGYTEHQRDYRFRLKLDSIYHPEVAAFREKYLLYATVYNQRVLKERPDEISGQWGERLLCAPVPLGDGHQIIRDTLYGEVALFAGVLSRSVN